MHYRGIYNNKCVFFNYFSYQHVVYSFHLHARRCKSATLTCQHGEPSRAAGQWICVCIYVYVICTVISIYEYIILYYIILYYIILYYFIWYYIILYYFILYDIILYYIILYYMILYYILLYYIHFFEQTKTTASCCLRCSLFPSFWSLFYICFIFECFRLQQLGSVFQVATRETPRRSWLTTPCWIVALDAAARETRDATTGGAK